MQEENSAQEVETSVEENVKTVEEVPPYIKNAIPEKVSAKRVKDESFNDYVFRRKQQCKELRTYLKGTVIKPFSGMNRKQLRQHMKQVEQKRKNTKKDEKKGGDVINGEG